MSSYIQMYRPIKPKFASHQVFCPCIVILNVAWSIKYIEVYLSSQHWIKMNCRWLIQIKMLHTLDSDLLILPNLYEALINSQKSPLHALEKLTMTYNKLMRQLYFPEWTVIEILLKWVRSMRKYTLHIEFDYHGISDMSELKSLRNPYTQPFYMHKGVLSIHCLNVCCYCLVLYIQCSEKTAAASNCIVGHTNLLIYMSCW